MPETPEAYGEEGNEREGKLTCLYLNARSIVKKFHYMEALVTVHQPSIIGISESWCRDSIEDAEINLHGYDLFRSDRGGGVRGGGNLLYVRETLQASAYGQYGQ